MNDHRMSESIQEVCHKGRVGVLEDLARTKEVEHHQKNWSCATVCCRLKLIVLLGRIVKCRIALQGPAKGFSANLLAGRDKKESGRSTLSGLLSFNSHLSKPRFLAAGIVPVRR